MGIKKSDIAALTGAATGAVKAVKKKMEGDKAKKQPTAQQTTDKSVAVNSAAPSQGSSAKQYGQNASDQADYDSSYGSPF